ncbi:hypothetical protein L6164_024022 [Bauhinia variegata]|uniref:Uncharacterized protein n=1 Tax=Bauhinia variegata TaxID=167791 RepID=A0ACB9LWA7_BAUVA|nr:hypothetical protein L6164_024022 [Bauhinia variegata]
MVQDCPYSILLTTPPHTPKHNGFVERRHLHIVETGLALLSHSSMPTQYWPHALCTAAHLINRLPTPTLNHLTPYEKLLGTPPNYNNLRSFGCLCYPWLCPYTANKLEPKSAPCVLVGYSPTQHAYHCLDPSTNRVYTSRHVRFIEDVFPFANTKTAATRSPNLSLDQWCFVYPYKIVGDQSAS